MKQWRYPVIFILYMHLNAIHGTCATNPALGKTHFIVDADNQTVVPAPHDNNTTPPEIGGSSENATVLFSPNDNVRDNLIELIKEEKEKISIAIYLLSDRDIAQALLDAHVRGVQIAIVTDPTCLRTRNNKIDELTSAGVTTYVYKGCKDSPGCMHNKFVIFEKNRNEKPLVWTGSFNFTPSASNHNHENVVIIQDEQIARQFGQQFEKIRKESHVLQTSETKIARYKPGSLRHRSTKNKVLHHYDSFLVRAQC